MYVFKANRFFVGESYNFMRNEGGINITWSNISCSSKLSLQYALSFVLGLFSGAYIEFLG